MNCTPHAPAFTKKQKKEHFGPKPATKKSSPLFHRHTHHLGTPLRATSSGCPPLTRHYTRHLPAPGFAGPQSFYPYPLHATTFARFEAPSTSQDTHTPTMFELFYKKMMFQRKHYEAYESLRLASTDVTTRKLKVVAEPHFTCATGCSELVSPWPQHQALRSMRKRRNKMLS